jgi:hypothetical protein
VGLTIILGRSLRVWLYSLKNSLQHGTMRDQISLWRRPLRRESMVWLRRFQTGAVQSIGRRWSAVALPWCWASAWWVGWRPRAAGLLSFFWLVNCMGVAPPHWLVSARVPPPPDPVLWAAGAGNTAPALFLGASCWFGHAFSGQSGLPGLLIGRYSDQGYFVPFTV